MTATHATRTSPRRPDLERGVAMRLAATEYGRVADLLQSLTPEDWTKPTDCPAWDVRGLAAHMLGMAEMAASIREQRRQVKAAERRGGVFIDELTALQVEERADLSPVAIATRFRTVGPKAARGRRRAPGFIRRRGVPQLNMVGGKLEAWTVGYLLDVILTRDPWMHRIDLVRATGADHVLTAEHDGVLVDDVVREWSSRHGQAFDLVLTGPAGGTWSAGQGGRHLELDAMEFCRIVSRRAPGDGLLDTEVPF